MIFRNEAMFGMLLIHGECRQNATRAEQLYADRFPDRQHPTRPTVTDVKK